MFLLPQVKRKAAVDQADFQEQVTLAHNLADAHERAAGIKKRYYSRKLKMMGEEAQSLRANMEEANQKIQNMEYMYKKATRTLEVDRGDLEHERSALESNLRRNVRKVDNTLKRMQALRLEKQGWAHHLGSVTKRLTFEKDCVEHRLCYEKKVYLSIYFTSLFI
jgi:hypothetical protein